MKKLLLLLVPLLFLVGCSSSGEDLSALEARVAALESVKAPTYEQIKHVDVNCVREYKSQKYAIKGKEAVWNCDIGEVVFGLTIETTSGGIYQIEVPARDLIAEELALDDENVSDLPYFPKVGDYWPQVGNWPTE